MPDPATSRGNGERVRMTKSEREELAKLVRERAKLGRVMAAERSAELLAEAEAQLAEIYSVEDERWADVTREAEDAIAKLEGELADRCTAARIPEIFRPRLNLGWSGRGQSGNKARRTELRRVLQSRIAAMEAKAVTKIDVAKVEALTEIARDGLETTTAMAFIDKMPTPAQLMPTFDRGELRLLLDQTEVPATNRYGGYDHD